MPRHDGLLSPLARYLPFPRLRPGATGGARRPVKRIVVFGRHPNPSSDYYFAARLAARGMPPCAFVDVRNEDLSRLDSDGTFAIVCRYASASVLNWIEAESGRLAGVGLFLDDDIAAVVTGRDATISYRFRLFVRALWPLRRLNRHLDIVWASTPRLADRLALARARVLLPAPSETLWRKSCPLQRPDDSVLIAYHATGVHVEEHRFLQPIVREVVALRPNVKFEVFGSPTVESIWRGIERVSLRRPISWTEYLREALSRHIDIMLVPLTPSAVNDCRSPTKRIDVARAGAAGIFSISSAYGLPGDDAEVILPYDKKVWRDAILALVDDPDKRRAAAAATGVRVAAMTQAAAAGLDLSA
jgi:hypothetical protein